MLSLDTTKRLIEALAGGATSPWGAGNEVATALNNSEAAVGQSGATLAAAIVAAHVSQTTDFAALAVGDLVIHIPATAGNAIFYTVATAGTLPVAAIVGDLYVAIRSLPLPAASAVRL